MNISTVKHGAGENIVLVHGWSQDHHAMQPLIDTLSQRYCVTAIDLPGAGKSTFDKTLNSFNAVADSILDVLPEKAIYIAWSWGGMVCQSIAGRYPKRVKQLILIGSSPRFIEADNWPGIPQPGFKPMIEDIHSTEDLKAFLIGFYDNEFHGDKSSNEYQKLVNILEEHGIPMTIEALNWGVNLIDEGDVRPEFANIQCPIDIIIGDKDESTPFDWQKVKALNANVTIHFIEDAQHMPFWTHPKAFNAVLDGVLKQ